MSDTAPRNFSPDGLSHNIAAALVAHHSVDPQGVTYGLSRWKNLLDANVCTGRHTWCHIYDTSESTVEWSLVADNTSACFGTHIVEIASGAFDLSYISVDDAAAALHSVLHAIT